MRMYTFYTDTHYRFIKDWFLPSLPESLWKTLTIRKMPQECETGAFHSPGWNDTMARKVQYVIDSIDECMLLGEKYFIHADCDIQFFRDPIDPITRAIEAEPGALIYAQNDITMACAGFFVCKATDYALWFWQEVKRRLGEFPNDQVALNRIATEHSIQISTLPKSFYTVGYATNGQDAWRGQPFEHDIPNDIVMHHANYAVGTSAKFDLLRRVRNEYARRS